MNHHHEVASCSPHVHLLLLGGLSIAFLLRGGSVMQTVARRVQVRLGKMSDLLDALMEQFPMPPPALFAANDIDKCVRQTAQETAAAHDALLQPCEWASCRPC